MYVDMLEAVCLGIEGMEGVNVLLLAKWKKLMKRCANRNRTVSFVASPE